MLGSLSTNERVHKLDVSIWGKRIESGVVACLADLCSLDEWFRTRSFIGEFNENREGHTEWATAKNVGAESLMIRP